MLPRNGDQCRVLLESRPRVDGPAKNSPAKTEKRSDAEIRKTGEDLRKEFLYSMFRILILNERVQSSTERPDVSRFFAERLSDEEVDSLRKTK